MRPRRDPSPALLALAAAQEYTLSRAQCFADGLGTDVIQRLIHSWWQVVTPGVYATHRLPVPWAARAWAGIHLGGGSARIGGRAAAHLHGFAPRPRLIQVWIDKRRLTPRPQIFFRQDEIGRRPTGGGIPLTTVADTVLDLCERASVDQIAATIASACNETAVTVDDIAACLGGRRLTHQASLIRECLDVFATGAHGALERRFLLDVERAHGLPQGHRQVWTSRSDRVDLLFPEYGCVVELDGRLGHAGTGAFRDRDRDNRHQVAGFMTLRYGWDDVAGAPCETARQIAAVLGQRGWPGPMTRCARCEAVPITW